MNESDQHAAMLRSHVERILQQVWDTDDLVADDDGDYPLRGRTSVCWVALVTDADPAGVRVFAQAARGLKPSAKLHAEINAMNTRSRWATISLVGGVAVVSSELHWTAVDATNLEHTLGSVLAMADDIGPLLATVFGGDTPFPLESTEAHPDEVA